MPIKDRKKTLTLGVIGAYGALGDAIVQKIPHLTCVTEVFLYGRDPSLTTYYYNDVLKRFSEEEQRKKLRAFEKINQEFLSADIIIVAAKGKYHLEPVTKRKRGKLRRNLARAYKKDKPIIQSLDRFLKDFKGILYMASNPVELFCDLSARDTNIPRNKIIGAGYIDSYRLKEKIREEFLAVHPKTSLALEEIVAPVAGTHDTFIVPLYSNTTIKGKPFSKFPKLADKKQLITYHVRYWALHGAFKGSAPRYEPGMAIVESIKKLKQGETISISVFDPDNKCYITLPAKLNKDGLIEKDLTLQMTADESREFRRAVKKLKRRVRWAKRN